MTDDIYPAGPASVPADFTTPNARYKRHVYLAMASLSLFLVLYFGLALWFAWTGYRLLTSLAQSPDWFMPLLGGSCSAFLALFMFSSLLVIRKGKHEGTELRPEQAPELFRFLERLAEEAKAPKPHKVFLSPQVNASVFYDVSVANLFFRSRKNLEIGLGLVNILSLGEFKAVLAHEFGHFGQSSMAVGRWIYTAQQITAHIVAARGRLDGILEWISGFDLRIAWLGWIMRLIVWSIRSLVESVFGWVVLAQRALSREMEFHADLVAASLTGSDALVHALHRLDAADEALDAAIEAAKSEANNDRRVPDLFALQSHLLLLRRRIFDDPEYGKVPPLPSHPEEHRIFDAKLAHPPRMWASHPPNEEREANVKKEYLATPLDDRSSWLLFDDAQALREHVTAEMFSESETPLALTTSDEAIANIEKRHDKRYLDPAYRGVYLGRSIVRAHGSASDMIAAPASANDLRAALTALYPPSLTGVLQQSKSLQEERTMLQAIERGILDLPGRVLKYRGQEHHRKELPRILKEVEAQLALTTGTLIEHDQQVRSVHQQAAHALSPAWRLYLEGLTKLIHYTGHREADISDAMHSLANVIDVVTADGHVSAKELERLLSTGTELHSLLQELHEQSDSIFIGEPLCEKLEVQSWQALLGEFTLPLPQAENIGEWMEALPSWVQGCTGPLNGLHSQALDHLLATEEEVAMAVNSGRSMDREAPEPPRVETRYQPLLEGNERPKQTKLGWWDRFQLADGWLPSFARLGTAGAIVGLVLVAGQSLGGAAVLIANGLSIPVEVSIGSAHVLMPPHSRQRLEVEPGDSIDLLAQTISGTTIETLEVDVDRDFSRYVYNIANASALQLWDPASNNDEALGAPRWQATEADTIKEARQGLSSSDESSVMVSFVTHSAQENLQRVPEDQKAAMIHSHLLWDATDSPSIGHWYAAAGEVGLDVPALLETRLGRSPDDVFLLRYQQDTSPNDEVCNKHRSAAESKPDDADWQYLAARCLKDPQQRSLTFESLSERWPRHSWLAFAAANGVLDDGDFERALQRIAVAQENPALQEIAANLRVRFLQALQGESQDLGAWVQAVPELELFHAMQADELADDAPSALIPLHDLSHGQVAAAAQKGSELPMLQVLIAASDGAPLELINKTLDALPKEELSPVLALYGVALARKADRSDEEFVRFLSEEGAEWQKIARFWSALDDPPAAEIILEGTGWQVRATAYAAAAVTMGAECPQQWRALARHLLFVGERPFLLAHEKPTGAELPTEPRTSP